MKQNNLEEAILEYAHDVGKAKRLIRTGWKEKVGVKSPESVAEHMYRTSVIAMALSDLAGLNTERVLKMTLLDDLAETVVGDLTPAQKKTQGFAKSKHQEENALQQILSSLPKLLREEYIGVWREAQSLKSKEAKLVKSSDKLEMAIKLVEFIESAGRKIHDPQTRKIFNLLKRETKLISSTMCE
jgi:putative hydrolase of HD superfamily